MIAEKARASAKEVKRCRCYERQRAKGARGHDLNNQACQKTVKRIVHTTSAKIEDHRGTDKERTTDCEE